MGTETLNVTIALYPTRPGAPTPHTDVICITPRPKRILITPNSTACTRSQRIKSLGIIIFHLLLCCGANLGELWTKYRSKVCVCVQVMGWKTFSPTSNEYLDQLAQALACLLQPECLSPRNFKSLSVSKRFVCVCVCVRDCIVVLRALILFRNNQ